LEFKLEEKRKKEGFEFEEGREKERPR